MPLSVGATQRCSSYVTCFTNHVSRHQLKNSGRSHAAADAHRHHAKLDLAALHFVQQGCRELCPGATERMSKSDCSTVHIDLERIQGGLPDYRQGLSREGFVKLDQTNVLKVQSGQLQRLRNGHCWSDAHFFGLHSSGRVCNKTTQHLPSTLGSPTFGGHNRCGSAIAHLRRVPSRHSSLGMESRLQLRQSIQRRIRTRSFILFES